MSNHNGNRINELITELSTCREDERNTQSQILQVISLVGTILGILFSASYLNSGAPQNENSPIMIFQNLDSIDVLFIKNLCSTLNEKITNTRVMFWLSMLLFCTAFSYIIVLGIDNLLRYFYIQNLEDRLHQLINDTEDDTNRGSFLHWNEFSAPIITRNFNHITSSHTALNYICYTIAICCAILFSMGLVLSLFIKIYPREPFDYFIIVIMLFFMIVTVILFFRLSTRAKRVAQFSWDTAHENQKIRLGEIKGKKIYGKSESFKHIFKYLIYPKTQDLQKPVLIIAGFVFGVFFSFRNITISDFQNILFALFVFDFLAYQARYQINDIRGIKEDKETGLQNRLLLDSINNPGHVIKVSIKVALLKILAAIVITICFGKHLTNILLICLLLLLISTLIYEFARSKKITWLIFFTVGSGYPLRFFLGFFSFVSTYNITMNQKTLIFYIIALWAYGSFSSILAWVNEVTNRIQKNRIEKNEFPSTYEKKHYEYLQKKVINRYLLAENNTINEKVLPLREKGYLNDPWNIYLLLSLIPLALSGIYEKNGAVYIILDFLFILCFIINIYVKRNLKLLYMTLGWICIIFKIVLGVLFINLSIRSILLSLTQVVITITYFILYYQPQYKEIRIVQLYKIIIYKIFCIILGEDIAKVICSKECDEMH